ncbi:MAG: hypothetical protein E6X43_07595 [Peptostreptococcaceae bacterium]|nr:hypothetical protein [Peptostreptococcaceae bacterium]
MDDNFIPLEELDLENCESKSSEDRLIDRVKKLSKKHSISFIEALEIIKYNESYLYYLEDIKSALYEIDRDIMGLTYKAEKCLENIADEMRSY